MVRWCYNDNLEMYNKRKKVENATQPLTSSRVMMIELDAREQCEGQRLELESELEEVQVGNSQETITKISKILPITTKLQLIILLKENSNLFAWMAVDIPGID